MEKRIRTSLQRMLAMLLCVAMLLPLLSVPSFADEVSQEGENSSAATEAETETTEATEETAATEEGSVENTSGETSDEASQETTETPVTSISDDQISAQADDGTFTILAGSDFQAYSDATNTATSTYDRAEHNMNLIMDKIILNHSIEAFMFCGDYNSVSYDDMQGYCTTGYNRLMGILRAKGVTATATEENMFFVQGNHDAWSVGNDIAFIDPTRGFDRPQYGVYVLNYKDYNSETQNIVTVQNTAANLKTWLDSQTVGEKPIFVISHVPLHYSLRAREKGDAQYAQYIVDVLNEAGLRGLNIIFLYGHNHNEANAGYMGGSTNFVAKGERIWVSNTAGTQLPPTERTINFTYMNAGFVGWFGNVKEGTTDDLTMSVFQISGDDVTITRYSRDGVFPLQEKVGTFYTGESGLGYTVDSITKNSPLHCSW